jgi:hypothetical protein
MRQLATFNLFVLAAALASASCAGHAVGQRSGRPMAMQDLTVPPKRLPSWCALAPADSERMPDGRIRGGLWARFQANPWSGTDRSVLAKIRERVDGAPLVPDGPPPTSRELSRFHLQLAAGVNEGYAAIYRQSGSSQVVLVYALRFADGQKPFHPPDTGASAQKARFELSSVVMVVTGDGGGCFQAVKEHLRAVASR